MRLRHDRSSLSGVFGLRVGIVMAGVLACTFAYGAPALAQTQVIVSNLPRTDYLATSLLVGEQMAQAFLTGGRSLQVHSVVLNMPTVSGSETLQLCDATSPSTGGIGSNCYAFGAGSLLSGTLYQFTPSATITLASTQTKYWIVLGGGESWLMTTADKTYDGYGSVPTDAVQAWNSGGEWGYYLLNDMYLVEFAVRLTDGTSVELRDFAATWSGDATLVTWKTGSEQDNAGFNVWRSDSAEGSYVRLTDTLIPAEGGASQGASYSYLDAGAAPGGTYFYKLEDVDTAGASVFHGPVQAADGTISLAAPGSGAVVRARRRARFVWSGETCDRFQVQFSRRADFSSRTIALPGAASLGAGPGRWTIRSSSVPTPAEWRRMKRLAGENGKLFWRVVGTDAAGNPLTSGVQALRIR